MSCPRPPMACAALPAGARSKTSVSRDGWVARSATTPSRRTCATCCVGCTAPASMWASATPRRARRAPPTRGSSCSSSRSSCAGPKGSIVLSTRIRLARNLEGYVFGQRAKDADRTAVLTRVEEASGASDLLKGAATIRLDRLERIERQLLHERHLVSKELAGLDRESRPRPGAALVVQGTVGVMVNEEDHLRLHGMRSGFAL